MLDENIAHDDKRGLYPSVKSVMRRNAVKIEVARAEYAFLPSL